jgi:hypothetical protein
MTKQLFIVIHYMVSNLILTPDLTFLRFQIGYCFLSSPTIHILVEKNGRLHPLGVPKFSWLSVSIVVPHLYLYPSSLSNYFRL